MDKTTGIILGILVIGGGALLLTRKKTVAAATTTDTAAKTTASTTSTTLTSAQMAQILADTQTKLDAAAKLAAAGNYSGASKAAQDAATTAANAGNTSAASQAAVAAASYADQANEVSAAKAALVNNTYAEATPATIASGLSTAFEIANSGLGGTAPVGGTITVTGQDGTKTFINTGSGYAVYTPAYAAAVSQVGALSSTQAAALKAAIISSGFATATDISKMSAAQYQVYAATIVANNPSILGGSTTGAPTADAAATAQAAAAAATAASMKAAVVNSDATLTYNEVAVQSGGGISGAISAAQAAGVTLQAPSGGGTVNIVQNLGTGAPSVVTTVATPTQAADYNKALAQGYTPFQAALISGISK
jgi:hypothetical protein